MLLCCLHERRTENEKEKEKEGCTAAALRFALACTLRYATRPCCMHTCTLAQHGCMHALHGCVLWCVLRCVPALHHASCVHLVDRCPPSLLLPRPSAHYLSASLRPAPPFSRTSHTRTSHSLRSRREEEGFREAVRPLPLRPFPFPCFCFSTCQYSVVLSVCFTTTTSYRPAT